MLVLSRQRDERIIIGDDIEITVVDIRGDKVRIGVTAPRQVTVHRREVHDAIQEERAWEKWFAGDSVKEPDAQARCGATPAEVDHA